MDRLVQRYILIVLIGVLRRAILNTDRTARAFVLFYIPGLLDQSYVEIPCFSLYTVNFSVGKYFYVRMPADLDQFGCENSH
jgi:hypothetical protein